MSKMRHGDSWCTVRRLVGEVFAHKNGLDLIESVSQNEPLYCVKGYKARSNGMHAQVGIVH